ncbi:MAG: dihydroorotate dehydrogenase [Candidatus Kerfeldbacteria bacterium]|nr:dihydroorotate dehydrogenase [Candidatus Kerfeldbacteria bacterium]
MKPINLAGLELEHPVMIGAGTCKTISDLKQALRTPASAVVIGSITADSRTGNGGDVYHDGGYFSLNSLGLPNPGMEYWRYQLRYYIENVEGSNPERKPLLVSVVGFTPEEYGLLAKTMLEQKARAIELNFGCPNIWGTEGQKPIPSFRRDMVRAILEAVSQAVADDTCIGVKLSPFSDPDQLKEIARTIADYVGLVQFVTTTNTFPNAYAVHPDGRPCISFSGSSGLAGLSGKAMKAVGLGQLQQLRSILPAPIQLVGVGGISSGQDVLDYLRAGATAVQVVTDYLNRGKASIDAILTELVELTEQSQPQASA